MTDKPSRSLLRTIGLGVLANALWEGIKLLAKPALCALITFIPLVTWAIKRLAPGKGWYDAMVPAALIALAFVGPFVILLAWNQAPKKRELVLVEDKLSRLTEPETRVLRYILDHGTVTEGALLASVPNSGLDPQSIPSAMTKGREMFLLTQAGYVTVGIGTIRGDVPTFSVNPAFQRGLDFLTRGIA
jgi:hypothetical protein